MGFPYISFGRMFLGADSEQKQKSQGVSVSRPRQGKRPRQGGACPTSTSVACGELEVVRGLSRVSGVVLGAARSGE